MAKRQSVNGNPNRHHGLMPNTSNVGGLVISSAMSGLIPGTYDIPEDFESEVKYLFGYINEDIQAAGGNLDNIAKITFWLTDPPTQRAALNAMWNNTFTDPDCRPARHVHKMEDVGRGRIHAEFIANVS